MTTPDELLVLALQLARENVEIHKGRPFGAVLASGGKVIATGVNAELATLDPTAHAEIEAIRAAVREEHRSSFEGHVMYASGHPCAMCLAAMYLAGIREVYYAYSNDDGEPYGITTHELYAELSKEPTEWAVKMQYRPVRLPGKDVYELWEEVRAQQAAP